MDGELHRKDIHCLQDVLIIEHADVANYLIDMASIESILLIREDSDAQYYMSDRRLVPKKCHKAYTKEGYLYFPDPSYRSYAGRVDRARFLQVSVEETVR